LNRVVAAAFVIVALPASGQTTNDPFATPIVADEGILRVDFREFATIPDMDGAAARMMLLVDEPGSRRLFVNDMRGPLYGVSYDGRTVIEYVNIDDPRWAMDVESSGRERGFQSFAFHPQFNVPDSPGYGKFYTWSDVTDTSPKADFTPTGEGDTHDTVLLEWTAEDATATTYDGARPREVFRLQQPFGNHNGGHISFNPLASQGDEDFGLLYIGNADGGSGGDPMNMAQNPASAFGKILRVDPLGTNAANGKYGIPATNPFVSRGPPGVLGEIWALGLRNPQRFEWDPANGSMYVADIGQNIVEELSPVTAGANLGWNVWEGSFRYASRAGVETGNTRGDASMTFPVAEYDHRDPILSGRSAVTGVVVYRGLAIPQLRGRILFGDLPTGEIFHVSADDPPAGGQAPIRRLLFNDDGEPKTLLQLIQAKNSDQGKEPASRTDLRFGLGPDQQVFILNKHDGTIRVIAPGG
jgi:hypothetical protein